MEITQELVEPLQWSEGMMLSPQHFQQNDIYWHQMLWHQMAQLQPYYWGLVDIDVETDEIKKGKLSIKGLQCVMPDGLVVQYPAVGQEETLSVDVSENPSMKAVGNTIKVFLTVPIRSEGSASPNSDIRRYLPVNGNTVLDENTGLGTLNVRRLRPLVEIFVGNNEDIPGKYHAIPLFELRRTQDGFSLTDYHPPLLRFSASQFLKEQSLDERLREMIRRMRSKALSLAGVEKESQQSAMPVNHRYRTIIRSLVAALPPLEVLIESDNAHPFNVYQALAALDGEVAGIKANLLPSPPEKYRHNDIEGGFAKMISSIEKTVDSLQLAYTAQHFTLDEQTGNFSIQLDKDIKTRFLDIEIRPRPGQNPRQIANWISQSRIASELVIQELKTRRQGGAKVGHLPKDQASGLDVSGNSLLFRLTNLSVDIDGESHTVMQAGKALLIEDGGIDDAPAAIVLQLPNEQRKHRG